MKNFLYIHYYSPNSSNPVSNKLLVIGLFRIWFGFELFKYIKL
jgi:hypothetical protein